eukprot:XP_025013707.1 precursor of CEP9 [Ricinus communis]
MAETLPLYKHAVLLLALIFCLQILYIEGRPISNTINLHQSKLAGQDHQEQTHTGFSDFAAASVDAFRPTPPGNSPGVGHPKAVVTSSSTTDQHSLTGLRHDYSNLHKSKETSPTSLDVFAAASTDDFRPTSPGYSPGVGHPKAVVTSSSTADQHSFTGVKDYYNNVHKSNHIVTTTSFDASAASTKDDFRPTAPGFSPGVGHPKKVVTSSSTKHSITGFKDDYRPTQPGHSPGVGHSYQKNNAGQDP